MARETWGVTRKASEGVGGILPGEGHGGITSAQEGWGGDIHGAGSGGMGDGGGGSLTPGRVGRTVFDEPYTDD